jgi:hypothetical protein
MKFLYFMFALIFSGNMVSQNLRNANWVFPIDNQINFLPLGFTPTASNLPITTGYIGFEGCASVSDTDGNLLMFSDGVRLWHVVGGTASLVTNGLLGGTSSAQNVIFIPKPGNADRFMIVTINGRSSSRRGIHVSEIDITGGIPTMILMNVPLLDMSGVPINPTYLNHGEAITSTVHSDGQNFWVVAAVQQAPSNNFTVLSYRLTATGFADASGTPNMPSGSMTYALNTTTNPDIRYPLCAKISRDKQWLAVTTHLDGVFVMRFNNTSGTLTDVGHVNLGGRRFYGLEFSPNSALLYYTADFESFPPPIPAVPRPSEIHQVDLQTLNETGSLITTLLPPLGYRAMQLALDDHIYIANFQNSLFDLVNPDNQATTLTLSTMDLGNITQHGLPQWVWQQGEGSCFYTLNEVTDVPAADIDHEERIQWIKAVNTINPTAEAIYHAGNYVELNPGFEAMSDARFSAYIEDCSNDFDYRMSSQGSAAQNKSALDANRSAAVTIYPNPAQKSITVAGDTIVERITIFSMDGKTMYQSDPHAASIDIDVSAFSQGMYFISVEFEHNRVQTKFIKK